METNQNVLHPNWSKLDQQWSQIKEILVSNSQEKLEHKPSPDKWSVIQIVQHLLRSETLSNRYIQKKLSFNPSLQPPSWSHGLRVAILKWYAGTRIPFKAPKTVGTEHLDPHKPKEDIIKEWEANRSEMKAFIHSLDPEILTKKIYKHPVVGRLTIPRMLDFFGWHTTRHLRQIVGVMGEW